MGPYQYQDDAVEMTISQGSFVILSMLYFAPTRFSNRQGPNFEDCSFLGESRNINDLAGVATPPRQGTYFVTAPMKSISDVGVDPLEGLWGDSSSVVTVM